MQTFQKDLNDSLKWGGGGGGGGGMSRMVEHTLIVTQVREIHVFKTQFEESVHYSKEYRNETETTGRLG